MNCQNDDLRIKEIKELPPPITLLEKFPAAESAANVIAHAREVTHKTLKDNDDRLLVVTSSCPIHGPVATKEYAARLLTLREGLQDELEIVIRVYFEEPRTTVGWRGLISDPHMDNSFQINNGLRTARKSLLDINDNGLPTVGEFPDMATPRRLADLVNWGTVGAYTTESQVYRGLASELPRPAGFKNDTDGMIEVAIDTINVVDASHCFLSVAEWGYSAITNASGSDDYHIILHGGKEPNYGTKHVAEVKEGPNKADLPAQVVIDPSHANLPKRFKKQMDVYTDICQQTADDEKTTTSVVVGSHLVEGDQNLESEEPLAYGKSITDACIDWDGIDALLRQLASVIKARRGQSLIVGYAVRVAYPVSHRRPDKARSVASDDVFHCQQRQTKELTHLQLTSSLLDG